MTEQTKSVQEKLGELKARLRRQPKLALAFSGGVDSAFLLKVAAETLGADNVIALTARAANFPDWEFAEAKELADSLGVRHICVDFDIFSIPEFVENSPERCYYCKKSLFDALLALARENGVGELTDGANTDDASDYRPGTRAAGELGVLSPLREAGLGKDDIRALSREYGLSSWDKPAFACLASRFPYGQPIRREDMERVGKAERFLFDRGFGNVRVRLHGDLARIEVPPGDRRRFFDETFMDEVDAGLRALGLNYVALDLQGYRRGSMNEGLDLSGA